MQAELKVLRGSSDAVQREGELMAKNSSLPLLLVAAARADTAIVSLLLERDADPHATDRDGVTALMLARRPLLLGHRHLFATLALSKSVWESS